MNFPATPLNDSSHTEKCNNLRPHDSAARPGMAPLLSDSSGNTLDAVGKVTDITPPSHKPVEGAKFVPGGALVNSDRSETLLLYTSDSLYAFTPGGECTRVCDLKGKPTGVAQFNGGVLILRGDGEPLRLERRDGQWVPTDFRVSLPSLSLTASHRSTLSSVIAPMHLKGSYNSRSVRLEETDAATLGSAYSRTYLNLADRAAASHLYIRPVMARYRLRGMSGDILYTSMPVLVGPSDGNPALDKVTFGLSGSGFSDTAEVILTAEAFAVTATVMSALPPEWFSLVKSVEIQVSPQLHLLESSHVPSGSFGAFGPSAGSVTVNLPGTDGSAEPAAPGSRMDSMVGAILSRHESAFETVASGYVSTSGDCVGLSRPFRAPFTDTSAEISRLHKLLATPLQPVDDTSMMLHTLSAPHGFMAGCHASGGDVHAWGRLTAMMFDGYGASEMASDCPIAAGTTPTACKVTFADGSSVVTTGVMEGRCPTRLSALAAYPSGDARELTVIIGTMMKRMELRPSADGRWSYHLNPSGLPMELDETLPYFVVPAAQPPVRVYPDAVGISRADSPLQLTAVARSCSGRMEGLTVSARRGASWDFSRTGFTGMASQGIDAIAVNSGRTAVTVSRLDSRGVTGAEYITVTPEGVMAACTGGDVVNVSGNKITTLLRNNESVAALGWSQQRGELWITGSGKSTISLTGKNIWFTRDDIVPTSMLTTPSGLYGTDAAGRIYHLSEETPGETRIHHRSRIPLAPGHPSLRRLNVELSSPGAQGTVELLCDNGAGSAHGVSVARYVIDGELNHPLCGRVAMPHSHYATLDIDLLTRTV